MKLLTISLIVILISSNFIYSQFGLGERLKRKLEAKIEQKAEEAINKAGEEGQEEQTDEQEEEKEKVEKKGNGQNEENNTESKTEKSFKSYSKFDFIPGEKIIFFEDFTQDNIGDFPVKWNTNGSGEVVTTNLYDGKWLKMIDDASYVPDIKYPFPENFTLEFDLLCSFDFDYANQSMGYFKFEIANVEDIKYALSSSYRDDFVHNELEYQFKDVARAWVKGEIKGGARLSNDVEGKWFQSQHKKPIHISVSANKQRYRMWINQTKVFDLPRILSPNPAYNVLKYTAYNINTDKEYNVLLSNVKFAEGVVDTRSKLMTEGKLVTNAITFDIGSDKIKPESYAMLKSISEVLTANPDVKIMIIGHTDSDGNPAKNQTLSESRAASVKNMLSTEFGIDSSRIQTSGKGDTMPVEDNSSSFGKAKNRRVEFVKL